jgi:hypothetical protein
MRIAVLSTVAVTVEVEVVVVEVAEFADNSVEIVVVAVVVVVVVAVVGAEVVVVVGAEVVVAVAAESAGIAAVGVGEQKSGTTLVVEATVW